MLAVLLLTSLTLTSPNPTAGAGLGALAADPPVQVWLNKNGWVQKGDRVKVYVRTDLDGYVVVLHAEPDGRIRVLFPVDPGDDYYLRSGHEYEIRGRADREAFRVYEPSGTGVVYAAFSRDPFRFTEFVRGDHWDYQLPDAWIVEQEPDADLTAIVHVMAAGASFQFDHIRYDIGEPVAYQRAYSGHSGYYGSPYYYPSSRFSLSIGFGYPSHVGFRVGYGPSYLSTCGSVFYYDPYYCGAFGFHARYHYPYFPFWYDPFFYSGFYYDPFYAPFYSRAYYYRPYRGYYGRRGYAGGRSRSTLSQYTFKPYDRAGFGSGGIGTRQRVAPTNGTGRGRGRRVATRLPSQTTGRRVVQSGRQTPGRRLAPTRTGEAGRRIRPDGWGITDGRRTVSPSDRGARRRSSDRHAPDRRVTPRTTERRPSQATPTRRLAPDHDARRRLDADSRRRATTRRTAEPVRKPSSTRRVTPSRRATPSRQAAPAPRSPSRSSARASSRSVRSRAATPTRNVEPQRRSASRAAPVRSSQRSVQPRVSRPSRPAARPTFRAPRSSVRARPAARPRAPARRRR